MIVKRFSKTEKEGSTAETIGKGIGYGGMVGLGAGATMGAVGHEGLRKAIKDPKLLEEISKNGKLSPEVMKKVAEMPRWKVAGSYGLHVGAKGALVGAGVAGAYAGYKHLTKKQKEHSNKELQEDAALAALGLGATGTAAGITYAKAGKKAKEEIAKEADNKLDREIMKLRGKQNAAYDKAEANAAKRWKISKWVDRKLHNGTIKEERIRNAEVYKNLDDFNKAEKSIRNAEKKALKGVKSKALKKAGKAAAIAGGTSAAIVGGKVAYDHFLRNKNK